jgi:hypothetical protein
MLRLFNKNRHRKYSQRSWNKLTRPALQPYASGVWDDAVDAATRFGAHLR